MPSLSNPPLGPKTIILALDGTANEFCPHNTNVIRLYSLFEKRTPEQVLYYQSGIGTVKNHFLWEPSSQTVYSIRNVFRQGFLSSNNYGAVGQRLSLVRSISQHNYQVVYFFVYPRSLDTHVSLPFYRTRLSAPPFTSPYRR